MFERVRLAADGDLVSRLEFDRPEQRILRAAGKWTRRQAKRQHRPSDPITDMVAKGKIGGVAWTGRAEDADDLSRLAGLVSLYTTHRYGSRLTSPDFNPSVNEGDWEAAVAHNMAVKLMFKFIEVSSYLPPAPGEPSPDS